MSRHKSIQESFRFAGADWELAKTVTASACSECKQAVATGEKAHRPSNKTPWRYRRICTECGDKLLESGTAKEIAV